MTETERVSIESHYSNVTLIKANRLIKQERVEQVDELLFKVKGSQEYQVHLVPLGHDEDGFPIDNGGMPFVTCSCPNGSARGGRPNCYHSAAVLIHLEQEHREEQHDGGGVSPGWTGHD